jgi:hypothetical protein
VPSLLLSIFDEPFGELMAVEPTDIER